MFRAWYLIIATLQGQSWVDMFRARSLGIATSRVLLVCSFLDLVSLERGIKKF